MKIEPVALRELAESDMFSMTEVYVALNSAADTIDTLSAEVEENEAVIRVWRSRTLRAEAEAEALRKDAERYRWLCDGNGYFMEENYLCGHENDKERADLMIDIEIQAGQ